MLYEKGTATLKFVRTDYEDAGLYTVEIDAGSGVIQSSANLEIAGMCALSSTPLSTQEYKHRIGLDFFYLVYYPHRRTKEG